MECKVANKSKKISFILLAILVVNLGCSLDARISSLGLPGNTNVSENPSESNPSSPTDPIPTTPTVTKPSGEPFFNNNVTAITEDSLGRKIYAGYFTHFTFNKENLVVKMARLNSDGSLDSTFDAGIGFNSSVNHVLETTNKEIIATGPFTAFNKTSTTRLVKINPSGALDTSYTPGIYDNIYDMAFNPSGQIIAIGSFYYWSIFANSQESIVRINSDGTRDTSFNIGTSFSPVRTAYAIDIQSDGKAIVGGNFNSYRGSSSPKITRINTDGSYDSTFSVGTGFNAQVTDLRVLSDGSIIVIGDFTSYNGTIGVNKIAKLSANGVIDLTFNVNIGTGLIQTPNVVKEIAGVGILIGGGFDSFNGSPAGCIVCLNSNGTICTGINLGTGVNSALTESISDFKKLNSTTLLISGTFNSFNSIPGKNLVALNLDGSASNQLQGFKGFDSGVTEIIVQSDGKVVAAGYFNLHNPIKAESIARFNSDQTLDEDFSTETSNLSNLNSISDINIDDNNKIWIAGFITTSGAHGANGIIRLNDDGSIDSSCTTALGSGFNSSSSKIAKQSDGKLLFNGGFTSFNSTSVSRAIRFNSDCTADNTFSTGTGFVGNVIHTLTQSDGKFIHVGTMTSYSGTTISKVIRVNSNGTLDGTYPNNAAKPNSINTAFLDTTDRLYLASFAGTFNGTAVSNVSRILPNGTVDTSFNIGTGFDITPSVIKVFDGKIYIGGEFLTFNSASRKYFIILNEDGSENTTITRPEAILPVTDIFFNSVTGKIDFGYKIPATSG
jgi:uncharacterized delta-60 repeat protein